MNLQQLQTNLLSLIKLRQTDADMTDNYLKNVSVSDNIKFVRKNALWWRIIQIEKYCPLTSGLLKASEKFEIEIINFFKESNYSAFREEVGIQFLEFITAKNLNTLQQCVSEFELALIQLKTGKPIIYKKQWTFDPYPIIGSLLQNSFSADNLKSGFFEVSVSYKKKEELFSVREIKSNKKIAQI